MTRSKQPELPSDDRGGAERSRSRDAIDALLADAALGRSEKIELLRKWRFEAEALQVATEEGMPPDPAVGESNLSRIDRALEELERS